MRLGPNDHLLLFPADSPRRNQILERLVQQREKHTRERERHGRLLSFVIAVSALSPSLWLQVFYLLRWIDKRRKLFLCSLRSVCRTRCFKACCNEGPSHYGAGVDWRGGQKRLLERVVAPLMIRAKSRSRETIRGKGRRRKRKSCMRGAEEQRILISVWWSASIPPLA